MFYNNLKMSAKLILAFLLITAIFIVVSVLVYSNMQNMKQKADLMDYTMEMMVTVRTDMQMVMELLEAGNNAESDTVWASHQTLIDEFDSFAEDITETAEEASLSSSVEQADEFHNSQFRPEIKQIYKLKQEEFDTSVLLANAMRGVETDFETISQMAGQLEESVKDIIAERIAAGATAAEVLSTENTWADVSMEMKTTIALSGLAIEEFAQDMEADAREELEKEYRATIDEFDVWVEALLNGAVTDEGAIAAVTLPELRDRIAEMETVHEVFQENAEEFINLKKDSTLISEKIKQAEERVDSTGRNMLEILSEVEETAAGLFERASAQAVRVSIGGVLIGVVLSISLALFISRSITRPLSLITKGAGSISEGDIQLGGINQSAFTKLHVQKDELGDIGRAFSKLTAYMEEKVGIAEKIAGGDLRVDVSIASEKDNLGKSLSTMVESLNEVLSQVVHAIDQVAGGSDQVSQASQSLSQGATEQASSIEEITSSIEQVNGQSKQNAENSEEANAIAKQANRSAETGSNQMQELIRAMEGITASSDEINKIVKTIDDISFQINLLALNANVEAARAGKYGKGFAVVAEEVRNLANRSGQSVQETSQRVEEANSNIRIGSELVEKTSQQLEEIVEGTGKVAQFLEEISVASKEQSQGIDQITEGLSQIDDVTQSNTASAEQSASSAEELSSQAQQLKAMIARFSLKGEETVTPLLELPEKTTGSR